MKHVVGAIRFVVYILLLHFITSQLGLHLVVNQANKIRDGIDDIFKRGIWKYIFFEDRYFQMVWIIMIAVIVFYFAAYFVRISYYPKTTRYSTYILIGLKTLFFGGMIINGATSDIYYSGTTNLLGGIIMCIMLLGIYVPFVIGVMSFEENEFG